MDKALRLQLLRAAVKDSVFLQSAWRDLDPEDFKDREEGVIVTASTKYWETYRQPIGPMLTSTVEDIVEDKRFGADSRARLKDLIRSIERNREQPVSVRALVDRVHAMKRARFNDNAIEEIITLHEQGKLNGSAFSDLVDRARKELDQGTIKSTDFMLWKEMKRRQMRRTAGDANKYPLMMIDPLDAKIKGPARGQMGLLLAPYKSGKGLALIHLAASYAMQGLNVCLLNLEDPEEIVEDRLDARLSGIPVKKLMHLPRKLRRRFRWVKRDIRGRLRLVDGTEGGWTVTRMEKLYEQLKSEGFICDVFIVDYDDEIEAEKQHKGESARRMEFADIYRRMRKAARNLNVIWWTASQTNKKAETKKYVTGQDAAEDISKIRKVFVAIGIGRDPDVADLRYLYVAAHKNDKSRFAVPIMTDFDSAIFYDSEATRRLRRKKER